MTDTPQKRLFRAIEKSDINMLKSVLNEGISLACNRKDFGSVFHEAINYGHDDIEILELLKKNGADINSKIDRTGDSVLHWAVMGDDKILRWLLENGAEVNSKNNKGETPLINIVRIADIEREDPVSPEEALTSYLILLEFSVDIHLTDNEGRTALHYAADNGLSEIVELLINKGADVNAIEMQGRTPLHFAVDSGRIDVVKILVKYGADINAQDYGLWTSLHIIADKYPSKLKSEHEDIIKYLIKSGATIDLAEDWNNSALCLASGNEHNIGNILVEAGADVNFNEGYPLRNAVFFEHDEFIEFLLKNGANPNSKESETLDICNSPIHIAALEGYLFGIRILHKYGADLEMLNIDGETPLCVAVRRGHDDIVKYLVDNGVNINHADYYGNTPEFLAKRFEYEDVTTILEKK